jgi:tRNA pseudouridine synthase 10
MNVRYDDRQIELGRRILAAGPICDECLGRRFAKVGRGLLNAERGRALREQLDEPGVVGTCWVCGGLFDRADVWAERAARRASGIEFETYLFGVELSARVEEMEALLEERYPTEDAESAKHAFNRVVGKAFEARLGRPATVAFVGPDLSFVVDVAADALRLHVASLYVYGRYRKLVRGIPQTRWPCRRCRGRGCTTCGFTGKQYPESVEEWIAAPLLDAADAEGAHLHGAGREDIDARMLGNGRPFVLELLSPRRRTLDLLALTDAVNVHARGRVEVGPLTLTERGSIVRLKEARAPKRYRAVVAFDEPVSDGELRAALAQLCGEIEQRTPQRVSHRRADRVRRRRLLAAAGQMDSPRSAVVEVEGDGGLYIKELVSGDGGRTSPSLADRLGVGAVVTELDVLEVRAGLPDG